MSEEEDEGDDAGLFQSGGVLPRLPAGIPEGPLHGFVGEHPISLYFASSSMVTEYLRCCITTGGGYEQSLLKMSDRLCSHA